MTTPAHDPTPRTLWMVAGAAVAFFLLWYVRDVVVIVSFAVVLAYVLDPIATAIERLPFPRGYRLPRPAAAATVMLALVIGGAWLMSWGAPRLVGEVAGFLQGIPHNTESLLASAHDWAARTGAAPYLDPIVASVRANLGTWLQSLGGGLLGWAGKLFGSLGELLGLIAIPLLAYYLIAEGDDVKASFMSFVPESGHERVHLAHHAVDRALKSYVRGQGLVSLIMGTIVGVALALLGFPAALLLGIIVGVAEVLPYVGFTVAAIAIALTGYGIDPLHAVLGVVVYAVINFVIGLLVTPRVMGRHLQMHPFVVTVSVLAGAELLGPPGAMLALPAAAVLQALAEDFTPKGRAPRASGRRRHRASEGAKGGGR